MVWDVGFIGYAFCADVRVAGVNCPVGGVLLRVLDRGSHS